MSDRSAVEVHFDHHAPISLAALYDLLADLVSRSPIAWNTAHGGYWLVTGYDEVREIYTDWERFSSLHDGVPDDPFARHDAGACPAPRTPRKGFAIPEAPARFVPTESDPPLHSDVRRIEAPFFAPKAVRSYADDIRRHVVEAIDEAAPRGSIDFAEFVASVTTKLTCTLLGVGADQWADYAAVVRGIGLAGFGDPDFPLEQFRTTQDRIRELCVEREQRPEQDVASALMRSSVLGEKLTVAESQTILNGLTFGSTDTTNTTTLHALIALSADRALRDRLTADHTLIPRAVEEFLRLYTPSLGAARTVTHDFDFHGFEFKEGQRVQVVNSAANRDPRKFPRPSEFDMERDNVNEHIAFAAGPHRCLGAPVARLEMRTILEEVLDRLPGYVIRADKVVEYPSKSGVLGYDSVPATFTASAAAPAPA
jgi:cytochrome P450